MTRRAVVGVAALALACVLSGCAPSPQAAGNSTAEGLADTITSNLQHDVQAGNPDQVLPLVGQWLSDPPQAFLRSQSGEVNVRILAQSSDRVDIAVWAWGKQPALSGGKSAWGHSCRRYTRESSGELTAAQLDCPGDLPTKPA